MKLNYVPRGYSSKMVIEIIERYKNGDSAWSMYKEYNIGATTIYKILEKNGIERRKGNTKVTFKQVLEIIQLYIEENFSSRAIAEKFELTHNAILDILDRNGIERRPSGWSASNVTENDYDEIAHRYEQGESIMELAAAFCVSSTPIMTALEEKGIERRKYYPMSESENWEKVQKHKYKRNFFHLIDTPEKAYWLCFFAADGKLQKNQIGFKLANKDDHHLIRFLQAIEFDGNLKNRLIYSIEESDFGGRQEQKAYKSASISIHSTEMANDLRYHLGLSLRENKTINFKKPPFLEESLLSHALRGYLDGDGCISYTKQNIKVSFCGTKETCEWIKIVLMTYCDAGDVKIHKDSKKNIYSVHWGGRYQVIRICRWLYQDAETFLQRKYEVFQRLEKESDYTHEPINVDNIIDRSLLKKMRQIKGMQLKELAQLIGVAKNTISRIEKSQTQSIKRCILEKWFQLLDISIIF